MSFLGEQKRLVFVTIGLVFLLFLGMSWGQYTFEALPLQLKQYTGLAGAADYGRLAQICKEMNEANCVEEMLTKKANSGEAASIDGLAELGHVQFQLKKYSATVETLQRYVMAGGSDTLAIFTLARALAETGAFDEAAAKFEEIIASKPEVVMHTVNEAYVNLLIKVGRNDDAKNFILKTQKRGDNTAGFMESQLQKLASNESTK